LLNSQDNKSDIIKNYSKENNNLKKEIGFLKREIEGMENHIKKLKLKIKNYRKIIKDSGLKEITTERKKEEMQINDSIEENLFSFHKNEVNKYGNLFVMRNDDKEEQTTVNQDKGNDQIMNIKMSSSKITEKVKPGTVREWSKSKTINDDLVTIRSSILSKDRKQQRTTLKHKDSLVAHNKSTDHYKRLSLQYRKYFIKKLESGNNEMVSLQYLINGQKSLFRYSMFLNF
jgi:hypothetical protein